MAERDATGRPVPPRLHRVFAGRRRLVCISDRIGRLLEDIAPCEGRIGAEALDFPALRRALCVAKQTVDRALPSRPCDCLAMTDCPWCRNRRWLSAAEAAAKAASTLPPS